MNHIKATLLISLASAGGFTLLITVIILSIDYIHIAAGLFIDIFSAISFAGWLTNGGYEFIEGLYDE